MPALHSTNTFNVRASFNQWIKDALASITMIHSTTYTFVDTWPETTMPTPAISVIHADVGRTSEYLGKLADTNLRGVSAVGLADVSVWVSRSNTNWQAHQNILISAVETVFAGTISVPVRNYMTTPALPTNAYTDQVIAVDSGNLIKYLVMNEETGTTAQDYSGNNLDGTYNGVTLDAATGFDLLPVPLFTDTGDYLTAYSAAFAALFNGAEGTLSFWAKPRNAAVWSDTTVRGLARFSDSSANNQVYVLKSNSANTLTFIYTANSVSKSVSVTTSPSDWFMVTLTWSAAADQMKAYVNGAQVGSTQTGLGVWNGSLFSTLALFGNVLASGSQANNWDGYLAHGALWDTPLTAAQVLALYNAQSDYVIRIANLDMGGTLADTGNPDIMRTRSQLRYEWTLRSNVS